MSAVIQFQPAASAAPSIQSLIEARIKAKRDEEAAVEARRAIDASIADYFRDENKPEGSVTEKVGDLKVTVTYGVTRKVNVEELQKKWAKLSAAAQSAFRWKADVSVTELRKLEGKDVDAAAAFVTTSPASPQIKISA